MEAFEKTMLKLFLDHPTDFQKYIPAYHDIGYAYRVIDNFIPTDTGLEFEIGPGLKNPILDNKRKGGYPKLYDENIEEVTFRIEKSRIAKDIEQLQRLYNYWRKPKFSKRRSSDSGIHIHTNIFSNFRFRDYESLKGTYNDELNLIVGITAKQYFDYYGSYNALRFSQSKGNSIIYRSEYDTIEFRCINMTWEFRELLKHIIFCHRWTKGLMLLAKGKIDVEHFKANVKADIALFRDI